MKKIFLFVMTALPLMFLHPSYVYALNEQKTATSNSIIDYIVFLPAIFLVVAVCLWKKYGHDDTVIETVELYPPDGLNSLEIGFLYKGVAEISDVTSLLIYLANKGYIKISEIEDGSLSPQNKIYKITKVKEYDGNNVNEQIFLDGLFTKINLPFSLNETSEDAEKFILNALFSGLKSTTFFPNNEVESKVEKPNEVTSNDLIENISFISTITKILHNMNSRENKKKIFEKTIFGKGKYILMMIIATYFLIVVPPAITVSEMFPLFQFFWQLLSTVFISIMLFLLLTSTKGKVKVNGKTVRSPISKTIITIFVLVLGCIIIFLFSGLQPLVTQNKIYLIGYVLGLISLVGMMLCIRYLPKRNNYGNKMLGKLKGYKNFLETVEQDKIEFISANDPTYFYNILPYASALGLYDKWIEKIKTNSIQNPPWYDSSSNFDASAFRLFLDSLASNQDNKFDC